MLFNSYGFLFVFLPAAFAGYFLLNRMRLVLAAKAWLALASLFFYTWWNVKYLPLLLASIFFNYAVGTSLTRGRSSPRFRKGLLVAGISGNLLLLGYYKYANFFMTNASRLLDLPFDPIPILLPLGISFFTFTQIAFLVDSHKGKAREYDFLNYVLFVTFFPHLIAGPIIHHGEMMPQFDRPRNKVVNWRNIFLGLLLFCMGLFKKVIIADTLAVKASFGFDQAPTLTLAESWLTSLSYTFQLYFDFSGYTDMALGLSLLFNIRLPFNFDSPYKSRSIGEFWRRWHITLSRFLRDYIYIPLGGNRSGRWTTYRNVLITFVLGGLWHGAGWTFLFWGALNGVGIVANRMWEARGRPMNRFLAWFLTFNFVNVCWVFFRAKDFDAAFKVLGGMFGMGASVKALTDTGPANNAVLVAMILAFAFKNSQERLAGARPRPLVVAFMLALAWISLLSMNTVSEFLYFNF